MKVALTAADFFERAESVDRSRPDVIDELDHSGSLAELSYADVADSVRANWSGQDRHVD
jgi:hypothetical protein